MVYKIIGTSDEEVPSNFEDLKTFFGKKIKLSTGDEELDIISVVKSGNVETGGEFLVEILYGKYTLIKKILELKMEDNYSEIEEIFKNHKDSKNYSLYLTAFNYQLILNFMKEIIKTDNWFFSGYTDSIEDVDNYFRGLKGKKIQEDLIELTEKDNFRSNDVSRVFGNIIIFFNNLKKHCDPKIKTKKKKDFYY